MPTYQYACTACSEQLEAVQAFTDAPLTECPACGGRLRKVFSAVGVVFKGSGFYKTDSRSSSTSSGEKKAADASTSTSGGDASSSSTPAPAKTETKASTPASGSSPAA